LECWALDSNVIAYWIIGKKILPYLVNEYLKMPDYLIKTYERRYINSIKLVDWYLSGKIKEIKFCTYELNMWEIINSVKDEIKTLFLFVKGHPLSRWKFMTRSIKVPEDVIESVYNLTMRSFDDLFYGENKIELFELPEVNIELFSYLLLHIPELQTHDGLILTACLIDEIKFLITNDSNFRDINECLKMLLKNRHLEFEIISPEKAIEILNKTKLK
jgi:phosphopantetheine adenylyltransferase